MILFTRLCQCPDAGALGKHTTGMMSSCSRALSTTSLMLSEPKPSSVALGAFGVPIGLRWETSPSGSHAYMDFLL